MGHEMEIVDAPDPLPVRFEYDRGRARVLLKIAGGSIDVRITSDYQSAPSTAGFGNPVQVIARDESGQEMRLFNERLGGFDKLKYWYWDLPYSGEERTRTFTFRFEEGEILGQYDGGVYERIPDPGPVELEFNIKNQYVVSTTSRLDVPDTARVKETTEVHSISLPVDGMTVSPTADVAVRAGHGVDLPVEVSASVGDKTVFTDTLTVEGLAGSTRGGPEVTPATFPAFELDAIPYASNELSFTVTGRDWAERWLETTTETVQVPNIAADDVTITGCRTRPQQLRVGEDLTVNSSVRNPLPTAVDVEGQFVFGGDTSPFSKTVPAGGITQLSAPFTATADGTATPTIELSTVDGIDVSAQTSCGEVAVDPAFSADRVSVGSCSVGTTDDVRPGDTVEATATVANDPDNAAATATVAFTSAGDTVTQTVGLAPGESKTASASFSYSESGDYPIDVALENATVR